MKATLKEVMDAVDALPEAKLALASEEGRLAYKAANEKVIAKMGWTDDQFIFAMAESLGQP